MVNKWTKIKLEKISELDFAIAILNERMDKLKQPYSELSQKIRKTTSKLEKLKLISKIRLG